MKRGPRVALGKTINNLQGSRHTVDLYIKKQPLPPEKAGRPLPVNHKKSDRRKRHDVKKKKNVIKKTPDTKNVNKLTAKKN